MKSNPWAHQPVGVELIRQHEGFLLDWQMGVGKSRVGVQYIVEDKPKNTLIVCPKSVIAVWPMEFDKHADLQKEKIMVTPLDQSTSKKKLDAWRKNSENAFAAGWSHVTIINYASARAKAIREQLIKKPVAPWDFLLLDEIHKCKSFGATSRAMMRLARKTAKRAGLTGTPMPHSPVDLYYQYQILDPSVFSMTFTEFKSRYVAYGGFSGREVVEYINTKDFRRRFFSISHQVKKRDVLELKEPIHIPWYVEMSPKARKHYEELRSLLITQLDKGLVTVANAMVKVGKLQQITSGFLKLDEGGTEAVCNAKLEALKDILDNIGPDQPLVVFTRFRQHEIDAITQAVESTGRPTAHIYSGVNTVGPKWEPERNSKGAAVAIIQVDAGGTGIDLTAASYCVYFSQTFNLGSYDQSLARLDRHGQEEQVTYYHLLTKNSVDGHIASVIERRRRDIETMTAPLGKDDKISDGELWTENIVKKRIIESLTGEAEEPEWPTS